MTADETSLQDAVVRALNQFNAEDTATYLALMKATIGDALGLNGGSDEVDLLERKIEALNRKMLELVNESVQGGDDIESHEDEFKELSDTIEQLKSRIQTIQERENPDSASDRLVQIQQIISDREQKKFQYDDAIVRQMIECIKVYPNGKLEIIFGGGYIVKESLTK